jgi:hypothetical protein
MMQVSAESSHHWAFNSWRLSDQLSAPVDGWNSGAQKIVLVDLIVFHFADVAFTRRDIQILRTGDPGEGTNSQVLFCFGRGQFWSGMARTYRESR